MARECNKDRYGPGSAFKVDIAIFRSTTSFQREMDDPNERLRKRGDLGLEFTRKCP
jgi:hypothetical protein